MREARIILNYYCERGDAVVRSDEGKGYGIIPFYNGVRDKYHEYARFVDFCNWRMHENCDYFGVLTWKVKQKTRLAAHEIKRLIESDTDRPDYYWIRDLYYEINPWQQGESCHPGLMKIGEFIRDGLGLSRDFLNLVTPGSFSSLHLLAPEKYREYINCCLGPCMELMEMAQGEFRDLLFRNCGHPCPFTPEYMIRTFGLPYATMHGVVLERMFMSYSVMKQWTGKMLDKPHDSR